MVKEFAAVSNAMQIRRLLKVLGQDFAMSKNPNTKKGGLIGLAAMAVGLGKVCIFPFVVNIKIYVINYYLIIIFRILLFILMI